MVLGTYTETIEPCPDSVKYGFIKGITDVSLQYPKEY